MIKRYPNGEIICKERMEDEDWFNYFQDLMEITTGEEFVFSPIENPSILLELFYNEWKDAPENIQSTKDFHL